jgi:uncharacterized membrane protein
MVMKSPVSISRIGRCCFGIAAIALMLVGAPVAFAQPLPCRYEVAHIIQAPPGAFGFPSPTSGVAISPNGRYVVGFFNPGAIGFDRAFAFDTLTEQFIVLPLPPNGFQSYAGDVTDAGLAVGSYWLTTGTAVQRGFVYDITAGQYLHELLPLPGGAWCAANAINSRNQVVGYRSIGSKGDPVNPFMAFIWSADDGFTDLGVMTGPNSSAEDIAEDATVVGWTGGNIVSLSARGFVWKAGKNAILPPVPGGLNSSARACARLVEESDEVVVTVTGSVQVPTGTANRGFLYRNGIFTPFGFVPAYDEVSIAHGVNGSGVVTGAVGQINPTVTRGAVRQANVVRDLNDLVPAGSPFTIDFASDVSPTGSILTSALHDGTVWAVVAVPHTTPGDAEPDCVVNAEDVISVILRWEESDSPADVTGDGVVDVEDLILVIDSWTSDGGWKGGG